MHAWADACVNGRPQVGLPHVGSAAAPEDTWPAAAAEGAGDGADDDEGADEAAGRWRQCLRWRQPEEAAGRQVEVAEAETAAWEEARDSRSREDATKAALASKGRGWARTR